MNETPNRYGANSREQEQWVLDGELHSGNPGEQHQEVPSFSSQQPVSSPEQAAEQEPHNRDSGNNFAAFPANPPQNNLGEQNNFASGNEPSVHHDFGAQNNGGNDFLQPPTSQPSYGQPASGYAGPNPYPQPQNSSPAGNNFPTPPGYQGSTNWNAPSGMPQSGGPGDMGPGSFSGLGDNPETPPQTPKSRALPITVLVVGIVMMLVVAPIVLVTMLVVSGLQLDSNKETHKGVSSITRTDDYQGTSFLIVEASKGADVRCDATFNGEAIDSLSGDDSLLSGFATDPDDDDQHTFIYNLNSDGTLKVKCEPIGDKDAVITSMGILPNVSFGPLVAAFVVPTIIGFTGLGLLIWGIIWTVKRGRDNRQALMTNSYYR